MFAFYKPNGINLEGNWKAKMIILDGKKNYPDTLADYLNFAPEVIINRWSKTMSIPINRKDITAEFQYANEDKDHLRIELLSTEKALNGNFDIIIDTLNTGPQSYIVDVKLTSNKTVINFEKQVIIPPWKPEFPKRGRP